MAHPTGCPFDHCFRFELLAFCREWKAWELGVKPSKHGETNTTQPRVETRTTLVGAERSRHCSIAVGFATLFYYSSLDSSSDSTSSRERRSSDENDGGLQTTDDPTPTDYPEDYPTTDDYGDNSWWVDDDYDLWGDEDVDDPDHLDPEFLASEKVSFLLAKQDESFLSSLGHQFEDMVLSCTYRGISCRY